MTVRTTYGLEVLPGDFAAVRTSDWSSGLIRVGEWLNGDGFENYEHAITYVGGSNDMILEAEPRGAGIAPMHYAPEACLWSTGSPKLALTDAQRSRVFEIAKVLEGTPYSWLDYFAIATHRLHMPAPGLQDFIQDSRHMICSQMVDYVRQSLDFQLFNDNRWDGYVTPEDLANLILASR